MSVTTIPTCDLTFVSRNARISTRTINTTALANEKAVRYLLQYGFDQSIQDSIAGLMVATRLELTPEGEDAFRRAVVKGMTKAERDELHTTCGRKHGYKYFNTEAMEDVRAGDFADNQDFTEKQLTLPAAERLYNMAAVYAVINAATADRQEDILSGSVAERAAGSAVKVDPVTRHMKELALAEVQRRVKKYAAANPDKPAISTENITALMEDYFTKNYATLRAEADKFFQPPTVTFTVGLADLFDDSDTEEPSNVDEEKEDVA